MVSLMRLTAWSKGHDVGYKKVERRPSGAGSAGTASGSGSNSRALPSPLAPDPDACSPEAVTGRNLSCPGTLRIRPQSSMANCGSRRLARTSAKRLRLGLLTVAAGLCIVEPHYSR